jgi:hypothetical protein
MEPRPTSTLPFSISVPGIAQPVTSDDVCSQLPAGLLSELPVYQDSGNFEYSASKLGDLLGETGPVVHPNLDETIYADRMNVSCVSRFSPVWAVASAIFTLSSAASSFMYKHETVLAPMERGSLLLAAVVLMGLAGASYYAATNEESSKPVCRSYSYMATFAAQLGCIKWDEYWRGMLIEGCDRKKLKQVYARAHEFGFRLCQLRKPGISLKRDGSPLSGADIWEFMMYNDDAGFASITRLLWAVEAAHRAVGKPLKMQIKAARGNAQFFLKLAETLSGKKPADLSLPNPHSEPLADLIDGAAYYIGLRNKVPTQAAALSAFLARYYFDHRIKHNASLMKDSMEYALQGKWGSAYGVHVSALQRPVQSAAEAERRIVAAIHHLGIALLMQERIIDGYGHNIIPSAYAYAFSAARVFNDLSREIPDARLCLDELMTTSLEIMRVMADNGPFVEFR